MGDTGVVSRLTELMSSRDNQLLVLLVFLFVVPIWAFQYFPSQDGPAHIANAKTLLEFYQPEYGVYGEYYEINSILTPNWFLHLILAGLLAFLPPLIVEKLLLTAYFLLLPFSALYALRAIRPESGYLALLILPFIHNFLLHMGFYAFCLSLPMFFLVLGFWMRHQSDFSLRDMVVFALLSFLLYAFHITIWSWAIGGIGVLVGWFTLLDIKEQWKEGGLNFRRLWRTFHARAMRPMYATLPTLALIITFVVEMHFRRFNFPPISERLHKLVNLTSLTSFDPLEEILAVALVVLFAALIVYHLMISRRSNPALRWDGLLFLLVPAYLVLYMITWEMGLVAPNGMEAGGFMIDRLNLIPFFAMLLWLALYEFKPAVKRGIQVIAVLISLGALGIHTERAAVLNEYINDYLSGMALIESNSTIMGLSFSDYGVDAEGEPISTKVQIFEHTSDYIVAERHVVSLVNYQPNCGYFPLLYREDRNPYRHIGEDLEEQPAKIDFLSYGERTGGQVDYVLLWGYDYQADSEHAQDIMRQLDVGYEEIHRSPKGLATLYRRKDRF